MDQLAASEGIRRDRIMVRLQAALRYEVVQNSGRGLGRSGRFPEAAA